MVERIVRLKPGQVRFVPPSMYFLRIRLHCIRKKEHSTMNFSDYLAQLPPNMVFEGLIKHSGQPRRILTASMVTEIADQFSIEKNLTQRFSALSEDARFFCSLAYLFLGGGLSFDKAPHGGLLGGGDYSPVKIAADKNTVDALMNAFDDELIRSFLVYAAHDEQGRMHYVGFEEFEHKLRKLCSHTIVKRAHVQAEKKELYSPPPAGLFLNDVTVLVVLASQGKLKKTKTGALGKSALQQVNNLLHFTHAPYDGANHNDLAPVLPLRYAINRRLVHVKEGEYAASHARMLAWLSKPLLGRCADFIEFACASALLWRKSLLLDVLHKPGKPWLSSQAFGEGLKTDVGASIKLLAYCGLVDFYRDMGTFVFTRSAQSPSDQDIVSKSLHATRMLLMPDFSAIIPQEIAPEYLYWFSKVGSLVSFDRVYKGAISREIINDSLSEGIAGDVLLGWLVKWQAPKNVAETVKEWVREFSRISLETGSFVVSAEEKVTTELMSYAPFKNVMEPVRAHTVFRVASGRERQVREILVAMGFDPRTPVFSTDDDDAREAEIPPDNARSTERMFPIVNFAAPSAPPPKPLTKGKYSALLKALDMTDLVHVVDYALLMGQYLRFEYRGSPYIKKGMYLARPLSYKKGAEPLLEAEMAGTRKKKAFLINNILKIGVEHGDA
jgi:hypothetical protein